jgi:hypothetical protein
MIGIILYTAKIPTEITIRKLKKRESGGKR